MSVPYTNIGSSAGRADAGRADAGRRPARCLCGRVYSCANMVRRRASPFPCENRIVHYTVAVEGVSNDRGWSSALWFIMCSLLSTVIPAISLHRRLSAHGTPLFSLLWLFISTETRSSRHIKASPQPTEGRCCLVNLMWWAITIVRLFWNFHDDSCYRIVSHDMIDLCVTIVYIFRLYVVMLPSFYYFRFM